MKRRWDVDERGRGVADARQFAREARELVARMEEPDWVAEEPEAHLLPHLRRLCEADDAPLALERTGVDDDGVFEVDLVWRGQGDWKWPALWSLIGAIAESGTYVRQRRENGALVCEVVTGMLEAETPFAPHGHTVRLRVR